MWTLWLVLGIVLWLGCGWVGSWALKRWWFDEGFAWRSQDEALARVFMFLGPIAMLMGVAIWQVKKNREHKGSWFGK